ncbi:MAG: hypothetical protein KDA79_01815 [Planctomycetaceae bacterium]|nr:hypothetical protein [Planctomycetaceae bacterium]
MSGSSLRLAKWSARIPGVAAVVLLTGLTLLQTDVSEAQSGRAEVVPTAAEAEAARNSESVTDAEVVSLNFFNTTWSQVLERVAEQSGSTLVGSTVPSGRFNRRDRTRYSRTEAIQILNRELAAQKFRLKEEGRFLLVLDLDSLRARYQRPALPLDPMDTARQNAAARQLPGSAAAPGGRDDLFRPIGSEGDGGNARTAAAETENTSNRTDRQRSQAGNSRPPAEPRRFESHHVRQADRTEENSPVAAAAGREQPARSVSASQAITIHNGRARDVGAAIYTALKERSRLIQAGPQGLPAFAVQPGEAPQEQQAAACTVEIDIPRNALVVTAPAQAAREMIQLIRRLDGHAGAKASLQQPQPGKVFDLVGHSVEQPAGSIRLVNFPGASEELATQIESTTARMRQASASTEDFVPKTVPRQPARRAQESLFADAEPNQPPPATAAPQPPAGEPAAPGAPMAPGAPAAPGRTGGRVSLPALIESLRGEVSVEALEELGVLILRGNEADVDSVMRVIRQLEVLGQGTVPEIHLLLLKNVNSESLAALLTSVYEELAGIRTSGTNTTRRVAVLPVVKPNAVLIIAAAAEMDAVLELASELDRPVDPATELEVFSLRHAVAEQVLELLNEFYEERPGLGTRIRFVADVRTNSVIVQGRPADLQEVGTLIRRIDKGKSGAVSRMRIVPLQHAVADELALVLTSAMQSILGAQSTSTAGGGGNLGGAAGAAGTISEELRQGRSAVLEFFSTDGEARKLLRSGLLTDIRITPEPRTNSLLIAAPDVSHKLMVELIRQLDRPATAVAEIKVFTLANSDAAAMVPLLESLFQQQEGGQGLPGVQLAGAEAAGSGLIPLRFSVDPRTNSIIASGGVESLQIVEAVLLRLDESDIRQRKNTVVKLKNSPVVEVAAAINTFLTSQRDLAQVDPELVSSTELLEREIIVVPEAVSNSLLISATPRYYDEILRLVGRLDEPPAQVIIQALLVEVELQNTDEFGVEIGFQDSVLFDRGITAADELLTIAQTTTSPNGVQTTTQQVVSQSATPGFLFNNQPLGNNINANPGKVGTQGLSDFSLGRVNGDLGFGGLVLSASSEAVSVLLRALAAQRTVHILSRPQIRTLDNQLAQIQVGQQVPVVDGVTVTATGVTNPLIRQDNAGIILTVTPRISPDGTIVMETVAEKSQFSGAGVPIFTDAATGNVIESPIKDITTARATVAVPNGQTIVLGGMITKTNDTLSRKVPWLGDLPVIGTAFRYDGTTSRRTELLIFLTPRIIRHDLDSEFIKQVEIERMHFLLDEAEEMHGPILAAPAEPGLSPEVCPPGTIHPGAGQPFPGASQAPEFLPGFGTEMAPTPQPETSIPQRSLPGNVPAAPPGQPLSPGQQLPAGPGAARTMPQTGEVPTTRMTSPSLPASPPTNQQAFQQEQQSPPTGRRSLFSRLTSSGQ